MQHDSIHHQIQLTAIRLWWNHAVILILSTEQEFDDIVDAVAKDSMLMFEDMDSAVKSFLMQVPYLRYLRMMTRQGNTRWISKHWYLILISNLDI